jgi:hypothetical protein
MTVTVTLRGGGSVKYMRSGDTYIKHNDGTLDVFRGVAKRPQSYASGQWAEVEGDQKSGKRRPFWG